MSSQAMRLATNAAKDCEEGSVEWLLNRRVVLWDRTKACFATKSSSAPMMYDLIRILLSKPEWTVYVGQAPLPPNRELESDVMMTAIISMENFIAASHDSADMLREQLVSALHYLPLGALDVLPQRVGRHIGMRRVRSVRARSARIQIIPLSHFISNINYFRKSLIPYNTLKHIRYESCTQKTFLGNTLHRH